MFTTHTVCVWVCVCVFRHVTIRSSMRKSLNDPPPPNQMELRYEIEDESLTLEGFLDQKMRDADMAQVERTYTLACKCLEDRKVKRPTIKEVHL